MVVDGLPLHAGVQLAINTTLVGALRDVTARRGAAVTRFGHCSTEEGAQVSRVGGAWSQITPRGSGGGGRQMVCGNDWLLGSLGKGEILWCSALVAQEGGVVMAPPMGIGFVMRSSVCCGHLPLNSHVRPVLMERYLPRMRQVACCDL